MYDLSDATGLDTAASVSPGTSLLVSGPAMTGKEDLLLDVLAAGADGDEGAVAVTTGNEGRELLGEIQSRAPDAEPYGLCAVDCLGDVAGEDTPEDRAYVHRVSAPSDMTAIGVGITNCFDRLEDAGFEHARLGLTNLSTMITYADRETVFKFCHVLSSRLDAAGFLGVFTIDEGAHDDQTLQVVKQAFDGLIELRERDGVRQARVLGIRPDPSEWVNL